MTEPTAGDQRAGERSPRIVVFDLGEVLSTPTGMIERLAARVAHEPESFERAYWLRRLEYDLGLDTITYWTDVLESLGVPATGDALEDLIRIDTESWTTIRADARELLRGLHEAGTRIGILSNATIEMAAACRQGEWAPWVTDWFFSAELGLAKPDPAIYHRVTQELELPAASILYIDDSRASVESATIQGWDSHLWTSPLATVTLLTEAGLIKRAATQEGGQWDRRMSGNKPAGGAS
ncbi:HAD-IA family hydrolase [Leifsonia sp. NPDC058292]|uniref:HAD-IA family hydrolase n=1 Tax=Leifsonia sp. NPDC058292 TaxID=3346428 RepID=UPI0036DB2ED0